MNILVTGATGFIGSHASEALAHDGHHVTVLGRSMYPRNDFVNAVYKNVHRITRGDARDRQLLERIAVDSEVDAVLHLAATSIVKQAYKAPAAVIANNTACTLAVLDVARQCDIDHVIAQGTDKVYGDGLDKEVGDPLSATEPYGTSKAMASLACDTYRKTYGLHVTEPRPCNVYGYDWNNRIVPNTIRKCLAGKSPVIFDGEHSKRQYIYIEDLLGFYKKMLKEKPAGPVNITGPDVLDQEQVVKTILEKFPGIQPIHVEKQGILQVQDQSMVATPGYAGKACLKDAIGPVIQSYRTWEG